MSFFRIALASPDESAIIGHRKRFRGHLKALSFFQRSAPEKEHMFPRRYTYVKWHFNISVLGNELMFVFRGACIHRVAFLVGI